MYLSLIVGVILMLISILVVSKEIGVRNSIRGILIIGVWGVLVSAESLYNMCVHENLVVLNLGKWLEVGDVDCSWLFRWDGVSSLMLCLISSVGLLVGVYSTDYMSNDKEVVKFFMLISLFGWLMEILVCGGNVLVMFIGWEGVGVCSFMLISFWNKRISGSKAANQAMIMNRIGDIGIVVGMMLSIILMKSIDFGIMRIYNDLLELEVNINNNVKWLDVIGLSMLIGSIGKSAQLGLHVWLPNAMEGPTPVSALIHAATMVTSGVYMLSRISFYVESNELLMEVIRFVGSGSLVISGLIGMFQNDVKKIVAYSTGSQLGYMVLCCGMSSYGVGILHMLNHGCFKAVLFLGCGSVIHGINDIQDTRRYGGLSRILPLSYCILLVGSISLMGIPFMTGYYSKDLIIEIAYMKGYKYSYICTLIGVISTSVYSTRLLMLSFIDNVKGYKREVEDSHDMADTVALVELALGLGSVILGYYLQELLVGVGSDILYVSSIDIRNDGDMVLLLEGEFGLVWVKWIPLILSIVGVMIGLEVNDLTGGDSMLYESYKRMYKILNRKVYFEKVYNEYIGQVLMDVGLISLYKGIDKGILERFGGLSINKVLEIIGSNERSGNYGKYHRSILTVFMLVFVIIFVITLK